VGTECIIIISFDPGVSTGWASYDDGKYHCGHLASADLTEVYNHLSFCGDPEPVIIYEDFKHRPQLIHAEMYSLQVIGVIRLWAQQHELPTYHYLPATAKAFWSDNKIKSLSLWTRGMTHAMDAMRVMLKYRMDTDPVWFKKIVKELRDNGSVD